MTPLTLDNALSNANRVYREQNIFLDRKLNVTMDPDQKGQFMDIMLYIQSQKKWRTSDKRLKKLRVFVGLLYKDVLLSLRIQKLFHLSIENDEAYDEALQFDISILYLGRKFYGMCYRDYHYGLQRIEYQKIRDSLKIRQMGELLFAGIVPKLQTREGIVFLSSFLDSYGIYQRDVKRLNKALNESQSPEVRQMAHEFLALEEMQKIFKTTKNYAKTFQDFIKDKIQPQIDFLDIYFPSILKYHEQIYKKRSNRLRCIWDYCLEGFSPLGPILESFQKEVRESEKVFSYLSVAHRNFHREKRKNLKCCLIKFASDSKKPTLLPNLHSYCLLEPNPISDTTQFERRRLQLKKWTEKSEEKEGSFPTPEQPISASSSADLPAFEPRSNLLDKPAKKSQEKKLSPPPPLSEVPSTRAALPAVVLSSRGPSLVVTPTKKQPNWKQMIDLKSVFKARFDKYAFHVTRWFKQPDTVLSEEPQYQHLPPNVKKKMQLFHAFPLVIDKFLGTNYCLQSTYDNPRTNQRDALYVIPAEIDFMGQICRGFFQYAIDSKTNVCYHRCFSDKTEHFTKQLLTQSFWDNVDFPSIEQANLAETTPIKELQIEDLPFSFDSILRTIEFTIGDVSIVLFRIGN